MINLQSYCYGQWVQGAGSDQAILNAVTGEPVATLNAGGFDAGDMLEYGKTKGQQALQQLSFHERAVRLKQLALYLLERKDRFYTLSAATGATRMDSWIDIEGGIQTLFSYSGTGRRELPNARFVVDGAPEPLSKKGTFVGQHIKVPIEGVAVHINAFNFPCWGMLEKLGVALLAGVPCIIKPASSTSFVAKAMFEAIIDSEIFPAGSLQFISGGVGNLLDHLDYQDIVSFTGSAATGHILRQHPGIQENNVRFMMESDSLNSSILGPDALPGSDEFDLYIKQIASEISIKCGQRCTAIRRAFIPEGLQQAVAKALKTELNKITLGDPALADVNMGALVSQQQRHDVRQAIGELQSSSEVIYGDPDHCSPQGADDEIGAFMSPVILYCDNPLAGTSVHDVEAFGPVTTLMPYADVDQLITLAKRGRGSLVASVATYDNEFASQTVSGLAAHHGRLLLLNRECASESTGHGSPLPRLLHGGPGRAGGAEELGGMRAVNHYFQSVALQGSPDQLTAVCGQWIRGAKRQTQDQHPFRKHFEELDIGASLVSESRTVTLEDIEHFAHFTGDEFYAHMDEEAAKANPFFEGRVAHGYFIVSLAAGLFVEPNPGPVLANYGVDNLRFMTPVYAGEELKVKLTCKQKTARIGEVYGEVRWDAEITNQDDVVVAEYDVLTLVAKLQ